MLLVLVSALVNLIDPITLAGYLVVGWFARNIVHALIGSAIWGLVLALLMAFSEPPVMSRPAWSWYNVGLVAGAMLGGAAVFGIRALFRRLLQVE
jgi:hypothetical protein